MDNLRKRIQANTKVETMLSDMGNFILSTGTNQKLAFLITSKYIKFTQELLEVFADFLPRESIETINNTLESCKKNILPYESCFIQHLKNCSLEFGSKTITLGHKARIITNEKNETVMKTDTFTLEKFSMKNILMHFLNETVLQKILEYKQELSKKETVENMVQTNFWKSQYQDDLNTVYLYISDYYDGFQPFNSIGKHSTPYAIDSVYFSVGPLPLEMSSKLSSIFTSQLSFTGDRKLFNNETIFRYHIEELKSLEEEGLDIPMSDGSSKKVIFVPHVFRGDNKSIKEAMGFVESFNTFYPCVSCKIEKSSLKSQTSLDTSLLRSRENILDDIAKNSPNTTGIKEKSLWLELKTFNPSINSACDIMHDMSEGVIHYDLAQALIYFIQTKKYFDLCLLNNRIQSFNFGKGAKNKPDLISMENLKKNKLPTTAAESLLLLETLPFIIGDLVPKYDDHWQLILLLREISKILFADRYTPGEENFMEQLIIEHHRSVYSQCDKILIYMTFNFISQTLH